MKNLILLLIAVLFTGNLAFAQSSATATLNLKLHALQSISVHHGQKVVDLEYNTVEKYQEGVTVTKKNHIEVFSTGGFQVSVSANDLTKAGSTNILANTINVEASEGNIQHATVTAYGSADLSLTAQPIITSSTGGNKERFDIKYSGQGLYINNDMGTYTTTVTYTINTL